MFNCCILKKKILPSFHFENKLLKIFKESSPSNTKKTLTKCAVIPNNHIPDVEFAQHLLLSQPHPVGISVL